MLTPAQVIPFLEHEDPEVRNHAVIYLAGAHDPAPATADDLWRAIDRFGPAGAASHSSRLAMLPQTDASLSRLLAALAALPPAKPEPAEGAKDADDPDADDVDIDDIDDIDDGSDSADESFRYDLLRALEELPFELLSRRWDEVRDNAAVPADVRAHLQERLDLAAQPVEPLWDRLMELAARLDGSQLDADGEREADRLNEALARRADLFAERAMALLRDESAKDWREIFLADLVGRMRLGESVDVLLDKLKDEESDILWDVSMDALARVGTEDVVRRIGDRFGAESDGFRISAGSVLGRFKRPDAEATLLRLLAAETDAGVVATLASSLCDLCPTEPEALEALRQEVLTDRYDRMIVHLDELLLTVGKMVGYEPPEAEQWRREIAESRRRWEEGMRDAGGFLAPTPADWSPSPIPLTGRLPALRPAPSRKSSVAHLIPEAVPQPAARGARKVGRNDPCPCGSGKKYKKCCLGK